MNDAPCAGPVKLPYAALGFSSPLRLLEHVDNTTPPPLDLNALPHIQPVARPRTYTSPPLKLSDSTFWQKGMHGP